MSWLLCWSKTERKTMHVDKTWGIWYGKQTQIFEIEANHRPIWLRSYIFAYFNRYDWIRVLKFVDFHRYNWPRILVIEYKYIDESIPLPIFVHIHRYEQLQKAEVETIHPDDWTRILVKEYKHIPKWDEIEVFMFKHEEINDEIAVFSSEYAVVIW